MKLKAIKMPLPHALNLQILFIALLFCPILLAAQGGNQWTTSIKVAGETNLADWVYDIITTNEKNYFAVGFAKEDEQDAIPRPDVPAFFLLTPNGTLIGDGYIEMPSLENAANIARGRLFNVVESEEAYFSVGCIDCFNDYTRGILVKVDKNDLTENHWSVKPTGYSRGRLNDLVLASNGTDNHLIGFGWAANSGNANDRKNWMVAFDLSNGNIIHELITDGQQGEIGASVHEVTPDGKVKIYAVSNTFVTDDTDGNTRRPNTDIQINITTYDPINQPTFSLVSSTPVNSISQRAYTGANLSAAIELSPTDIFYNNKPQFPPNLYDGALFDQYPYGPKYVGTDFARAFENCNEEEYLEHDLLYVEDFSDGSDDVPFGIVKSGNKLIVTALLNRLIMWGRGATGTNIGLGNNDLLPNDQVLLKSGIQCTENAECDYDYESDGYYWGEAYAIRFNINPDATASLDKAIYLGTMSGGDFIPKIIQTSDGGFAVSGTITSCPAGLDPVGESEHMMVIKLDANGDIIWREHYNGPSEGACGFAITETPDGGIIIAGNTEGNGEEDACIIKLGSDCDYGTATVLPNSGNDYVLAADETWDTDRSVKARVVVPAGKTLRINGTSSVKTTIRFADSKEVFGFNNRAIIGITVQKGGTLYVSNAILTGYDCSGTFKMWDGINVEGDPSLPQTNANQGYATFILSDVVNARQGVVASGAWCGTPAPIVNTYAGTGSESTTYTSALYHGGPFNGAKIFGLHSRWIDNKRSAIFMKYDHNSNASRFINCDFISNGPLADLNEMLAPIPNDFNYNEPRGTQTHVSIWSTRVQFSNCDFSGSTDIITDYRPFGIEGDDPKIVVSSGNMKDLKIGIECRSPFGSILGSVNATSGITFDNVVQGINLRNSTADKIVGCHFLNIPTEWITPSPTGATNVGFPSGIFGKFNKGTEIRDNDFHGTSASELAFGVVEHNTLDQGCEILENQFFNSRIGNQFEGNNGQLFARCNDYTGMGFSGWSAMENVNVGVLPPQGLPGIGQQKADNEFFDICDGSSDIHIFSEFAFSYFDKAGNPHPADEDCVSDIVNFDKTFDPSGLNCAPYYPPCDPPCRLAQYYASPGTIRDRNTAIRGLIHAGFDLEGADLPADYESALGLLQYRNQPEDQILRIGSLASMGRMTEALTVNNLLSSSTSENAAYKAYLNNILSAGTDLTALPSPNYSAAMESLTAENISTRGMAENLQYFKEGIYHPLVAISPEGGEWRPSIERFEITPTDKTLMVKVYPNPFSSEVIFDLNGMDEGKYALTITDLFGRIVLSSHLDGSPRFKWETGQVPDGQYLYQVRTDKGIVQSGKFLKTPN